MNEIEVKLSSTAAWPAWQMIQPRDHHGIALPLFSIHSINSSGIGEYLDLLPLISWCQSVGMDIIQLLPLNDTGLDCSPYNAISAFALSPVFLSLHALPHLNLINNAQIKIAKMAYWTKTDRVKHHIVRELKNVFFKEYIPAVKSHLLLDPHYEQFARQNQHWLEPYAIFKSLKEKYFWKHWEDWPDGYRNLSMQHYQELLSTLKESIDYHQLLQFLCYQQLTSVKQEAKKQGIFLKGDIPILISRDSADVWHHKHLFQLEFSAGAPPDMYTQEGQNWGFPIYNWSQFEQQEDNWWIKRIQFASNFYHLYRIDHIVGFFRIWAIGLDKPASEGFFLPTDPIASLSAGKQMLMMLLQASTMLPIGEDLGVVPPEVKQILTSLGICGTKVMRWERYYDTDGSFIPVHEYPFLSMTTVSTHDSDPLTLWWKHFPKEARQFSEFKGWDYRPFLTSDRHKVILRDSHHSGSIFHINLLQEYLSLFPNYISQGMSDERINIPGKILDTNWTYRFKPSVEELLHDAELKECIKSIVYEGE